MRSPSPRPQAPQSATAQSATAQSATAQNVPAQSATPQRAMPRKIGPAQVVDQGYRAPAAQPVQRQPATPHRPARSAARSAPGAGRLRWMAHRPLNTFPPRRPPAKPAAARTPRYLQIPTWGLRDVSFTPPETTDDDARPEAGLRSALRVTWILLAVAAGMQLLRYLTLMVNRGRPIPSWFDAVTLILLLAAGVLAVLAVLWSAYAFVNWMRAVRTSSYGLAGTREPRPWPLIVVATLLPFANVIGAPFLLLEAASAVGGVRADAARREIQRGAVAWGLVSLIGLIALVYRIVAAGSDSIQTGANAMVWGLLALIASAAFARWLGPRLGKMTVLGHEPVAAVERRLVVAA